MKENENILLTVAIPTYNRVEFLKRSLGSLLSQLEAGVEILISDNASTDGTEMFVKPFLSQYPMLNYIRNESNIGPDGNFLQCYRKANGKFVLLLGDDDVIVDGAIKRILNYIQSHSVETDLVFLNHVFFDKKYTGLENCTKPFWNGKKDLILYNKKDFMQIAKHQLTYMSAFMLQKSAFLRVENPEKYTGTSFIHACIVFEATKSADSCFGAIAFPCIAQNSAFEDSGFASHPERMFQVFGQSEEFVYCELAPSFGYNKEQMGEIYSNFILSSWPRTILSLKAQNNKNWKEMYMKYGRPALMKHPALYRRIRPYALFPAWAARLIRNAKRKIQHKP